MLSEPAQQWMSAFRQFLESEQRVALTGVVSQNFPL